MSYTHVKDFNGAAEGFLSWDELNNGSSLFQMGELASASPAMR